MAESDFECDGRRFDLHSIDYFRFLALLGLLICYVSEIGQNVKRLSVLNLL